MINAEFLRKVSKDRGKALTCQYLTDIDDDNIKELLNKAIWASIGGKYSTCLAIETTEEHLREIYENLKCLGFKILMQTPWYSWTSEILKIDFTENTKIFYEIKISWELGD